MNRVWEHSQAAGTPLLVLLCLADWANDDGECWPSISTIGRKCRLKDSRHVKRVIRELEKINEVVVVVEGGKSSRKGGVRSNLYTITVHMPAEPIVADRPPSASDDSGSQTPQTVVEGPPPIVADRPPEPSLDSSMIRQPLAPTEVDAEKASLRDALSKACYPSQGALTSREKGALNTAVQGIFEVGGRADVIPEVVIAWVALFPRAVMKPMGLCNNWNSLIEWTKPAPNFVVAHAEIDYEEPWYRDRTRYIDLTITDPDEALELIRGELAGHPEDVDPAFRDWQRNTGNVLEPF